MSKIKTAEFITSIASLSVYEAYAPKYDCGEICIVGRSNVGKSSFINMLTSRKIAKTSSTPGRTRLINLFSINDNELMLVDLPGYGYAKASKTEKDKWGELIEGYLEKSTKLMHVFSLVDIRHEPSEGDRQMIKYLYYYGLPFTVIATKADKISKAEVGRNVQKIATTFAIGRDNIIPVSTIGNLNKDKVEQKIVDILFSSTEKLETEESL